MAEYVEEMSMGWSSRCGQDNENNVVEVVVSEGLN